MTSRRDIDWLRGEIDDLFSELWQVPRFAARSSFRPHVDCYRTEEPAEITVVVEIPGVDPEAVRIVATPQALLVAGERRRPRADDRVYQQMELDYGPFRRELLLGADVDPERGRASYDNGLLTIVLPLAQRAPTTTKVPIEVRRGS